MSGGYTMLESFLNWGSVVGRVCVRRGLGEDVVLKIISDVRQAGRG